MKVIYLLILLSLLSLPSFASWNKDKGDSFVKLSALYQEADEHFTDQGLIDPNATRTHLFLNFYGEFGISKKFNLIAFVPFFASVAQNEQVSQANGGAIQGGEQFSSLGDSDIALRYSIVQNSHLALSTTLTLGIPTGQDRGGSDGSFQTGDGEFNQKLELGLGVPFKLGQIPSYLKLSAGHNFRSNGFNDQRFALAELGVSFAKGKLLLLSRLNYLDSIDDGSSQSTSQGSIFANNISLLNLDLEVNIQVNKNWGLSFTYTEPQDGEIVFASPSYTFGVYF